MVQSRLLDIAVREFSQKGLEGASTREIAAAAGTVMSSITYHYGGKEGLYLATADYIAEQMALDAGAAIMVSDHNELSPVQARAAIHGVVAHFVDKLVGHQSSAWSMFIVREQMNPTEAFERLWNGPMGAMMERLVSLVCVASSRRDERAARITAITMLGQAIVLRASRASCLKLLRTNDIDTATLTEIKARIAANIDATLDTLTAERQEPQ
jgi:AcrR family transcriptional regulator